MKIFKNYTFTWWQIGLLKLSLLCFGLILGSNWPIVFVPYTWCLLLVFLITALYLMTISLKQ